MDEIQAAVIRAKLPLVDAWTRARREIAARYDAATRGRGAVGQRILPGTESARHLYTVRVARRDAVREALRARGVETGVYYPVPLNRQACFAPFEPAACPVAERIAEEVLSLPCFPGLEPEEQALVVASLAEVLPAV
jgi:dTDP-4-amino-4,6-dideoxygalactose transaminase